MISPPPLPDRRNGSIDRAAESADEIQLIQSGNGPGQRDLVKTSANTEKIVDAPSLIEISRPLLPSAESLYPYLQRMDAARRYSNFGPLVAEFEQRLGERLPRGTGVVTGVNATQLLTLALQTLDCSEGTYCILPSWTFVATAHAVVAAGLIPYFVDVTEADGELTPEIASEAVEKIGGPVGCIMPVMPFGAWIDVAAWADFRARTGIPVIVDGAAGFDSLRSAEVPVVVSLHATKVLGVGEGGFIASTEAGFLEGVRQRSNFGFRGNRTAEVTSTNAKMSEYSAAVGLAGLDSWSASRLKWLLSATKLRTALDKIPTVRFQPGWGLTWVSSTCVVRLDPKIRNHVDDVFKDRGVSMRNWWGIGCHAEVAFKDMRRSDLPNTVSWAENSVGLPYYPDLSHQDAEDAASALMAAAFRVEKGSDAS